jgi:hypothetical protein
MDAEAQGGNGGKIGNSDGDNELRLTCGVLRARRMAHGHEYEGEHGANSGSTVGHETR